MCRKKKRETHTKWGKQYINVPTTDNMPIITVLYLIIRLKELQTQGKNNTNIKMKEYAINFAFVAKGVIPSRISRISSAIVYVFYINVHVSRSNMCILTVCYEDGVLVKL